MSQQPKRSPGERNPRPDADAPMRVVRDSELAGIDGGYGINGLTITGGVFALLDWLKRRNNRD